MDGSLAIEANREALKRIVATLADMAGFAEHSAAPTSSSEGAPTSPLWGGRREASGGGREGPHAGTSQAGQTENIATAPPDPLTASLRSAPLPLIGGEVERASSQPPTPLPLEGGEEGRSSSQLPTPLPRRSGERWSAKPIGEGVDRTPATRRPGAHRPPGPAGEREAAPKLPRLLWRAILAILRPAESAARRLIIAAARGIVVDPPRPRPRKPQSPPIDPIYRKLGLAVRYRPAKAARPEHKKAGLSALARRAKADGGGAHTGIEPARPRIPAFPLSDPRRYLGPPRRRTVPPHLAPRIMYPGLVEPHRLPPPPSAEDRIDATRLIRRIASLAAALDDLPGQARRFARLQARRKAIAARHPDRPRRLHPIRHTRPPGGRLFRYDPDAAHPKNIREVDEILAHAHALAMYALQYPDTS